MKDLLPSPFLLEDRLFQKLEGNLCELARQRRAHLLNVTRGTTFEVIVFMDEDPLPYRFSFTRSPTLLDVAQCLSAFNIDAKVAEITIKTVKSDLSIISDMAVPA